MRKVGSDCYQWGNQKVYCGDGAYEKALAQGQAVYQTGWREAENVSTISIEQLGVGVEFKFPQDWFEPPFTEFVLVSKEELSEDEWKIVFDPLVKKGVSDIEATIPSDTRFVLLQEMDYGYESKDDDDYLPDSLSDFEAEYQPTQTLSDYSPEQLTESSAIEGFQPLKYSVVSSNAEEMSCPPATQDSALNRKNQESTYENHDYGPRDVTNPGDYWEEMAKFWEVNVEKAKKQNCGNCVAYDVSSRMKECGVGENLGYCWMHNFKCQSARTCNTWAKGGPIKTDKVSQEWQERAFGGTKTTSKVATKATRPQVLAADSKEDARLKKYEKTYGKEGAKVRNRIFKRILAKAQDGTKAGQWSARKAQSLAEDYEKAMGKKGKKPYKSSKKTKSQKSLKDWGDQDWKTKSGKKSSKTGERYLPAKAIDSLTDKEYKKTSDKKRKDMKKGKQFSDQPKSIADKVAKYRAEFTDNCEFCPNDVKVISDDDGYACVDCGTLTCYGCGSGDEEKYPYCPSCLEKFESETFEAEKIKDSHIGYYDNKAQIDFLENRKTVILEQMDSIIKRYVSYRDEYKRGSQEYKWTQGDIKDIRAIKSEIRKSNWNQARFMCANLDSAVRDWMPDELWQAEEIYPDDGWSAENFSAEGDKKPHSVTISRSSNSEKKLMAVFEDSEGKKIKTTHFGQRGASDYTKHGEKERMERYLERHGGGFETSTKENWKDPTTAGALSRWILWNKPSLNASFDDYKSRFGLKGSINVSKSAEERKCKSCEKPATNVVQEGSFCYDCLPINLGAENKVKFPTFQFAGSVLLVSLLPLFLDNRRDKV